MKILLWIGNGLFIDSFGGAEKVACNLANELVRRGGSATIVCNDLKKGNPAYPLDKNIRLFNLNGTGRELGAVPFRWKLLREMTRPLKKWGGSFGIDRYKIAKMRAFSDRLDQILRQERPEVILSFFLDDLVALELCPASRSIPIVQMIHDTPEIAIDASSSLVRKSLKRADRVQVLLKSFADAVKSRYSVETVVIPNVVPQYEECVSYEAKPAYRLLNVARLDQKQKQQHLLIEAFAQIAKDFPCWTLHFYGDQRDEKYRRRLVEQIAFHQLEQRVFLEGPSRRMKEELLNADLFAFPSSREGFSLALTEAMALGLPAIGFRNAPSVNELIQDNKTGLLTEESPEALAKGLKTLMCDRLLRQRLGRNAKESVRPFRAENVWNRWESLLNEVIASFEPRKK